MNLREIQSLLHDISYPFLQLSVRGEYGRYMMQGRYITEDNYGTPQAHYTRDLLESHAALKWEEACAHDHTPHPVDTRGILLLGAMGRLPILPKRSSAPMAPIAGRGRCAFRGSSPLDTGHRALIVRDRRCKLRYDCGDDIGPGGLSQSGIPSQPNRPVSRARQPGEGRWGRRGWPCP